MGLLEHSSEVDYPYSKRDVFGAVVAALGDLNIGVADSDELSGRISANTGISLTSFGERVSITLIEQPNGHTLLQISSASKSAVGTFIGNPIMNAGCNGRIVDRIFSATSDKLQTSGASIVTTKARESVEEGPAARIAQAKALLDGGLITQSEYDQKRAEILSRL